MIRTSFFHSRTFQSPAREPPIRAEDRWKGTRAMMMTGGKSHGGLVTKVRRMRITKHSMFPFKQRLYLIQSHADGWIEPS